MITSTHVRNALTGALAVMVLGLFASCSESPVAPLDDAVGVVEPSAALVPSPVQTCKLVNGVWVCSTPVSGGALMDEGRQQCILIGGVLYCEPTDEL